MQVWMQKTIHVAQHSCAESSGPVAHGVTPENAAFWRLSGVHVSNLLPIRVTINAAPGHKKRVQATCMILWRKQSGR
jgi:hypothetical protein